MNNEIKGQDKNKRILVILNLFQDLSKILMSRHIGKMLHFVKTGSPKIFKILKQVQNDKNFGSLCQVGSA